MHLVFKFAPEADTQARLKLKIEINTREHTHLFGLKPYPFAVESDWYEGKREIASFEPEELFGTKRLRRMTDAQARRGAARDPDNPPADGAWLAAGHVVAPVKKQAISLRLEPDVVDWFRNTGPRYQSRMNAVLRAFVEHQRQGEESRTKRTRAG